LATRQEFRTPLRVLVVEDSEDDALLILRELERGGYEPDYERVETTEAMKKALARSRWDVIISDYRLPRFGAPEALALLHDSGYDVTFIVVSGKVKEDLAIEVMKAGAHDYVMKDNLTRLCATVERGLEEAKERRELRRAEKELRRHDAILDAVSFAAERFLSSPSGWERDIEEVLERLGEAAETSRVYIFKNHTGEDGKLWNIQFHKWQMPGVSPGLPAGPDGSWITDFPYRDDGTGRWADFGRWEEVLSRGDPVYGNTREFPESERPFLRDTLGILSMILVPIFVEEEWWGFIGFDDCTEERDWSVTEIDALKAAASTLGAALQRQVTEEQLRVSEAHYRAVVEQATDGIYLLDSSNKRLLETNPAFQKMLGYSADELRGMEVYDFVAHPRGNVDSTIQSTLEQRSRIVGGRKYRRKDDSLLDVEVGVSVISYGGKDVICTIVRDVTERKRSEKALKESEARHRAVVDTALDGIITMSADGLIRSFNHSAKRIFGYTAEEVAGQRLEMLMPERFRSSHRGGLRRYLKTREAHVVGKRRLELAGRRKDGAEFPLELSISETSEGEDILFIGIVRDITERKQAEEELKESEERFKGLAEATFEGIAITQDGKIVETNASFAAMFGYEPSEVIGMTPADVTAPESREAVRNARSSRHDQPYEAVCLRKDGTTFEGEIRGRTFSYKGYPVRVTAIRDITERKQAEVALRQSEQLYRTVIEQAAENICLIDAETTRILESNPAFQGTLGYTEEELRHMTVYDIVVHGRESIDRNIGRAVQQKRYFVGERKYRRKDGSLVDVEVSMSTILLDGRETLCVVAHDISERARVQELLEERLATLSGIAANLALDLPVGSILDVLAEGVVNASTAVASLVILTGEKTDTLHTSGSYGLPEGYTAGLQAAYSAGVQSPTIETFRKHGPMLMPGFRRFVLNDPLYAPIHHFVREASWDTLYIVPLISRGHALGAINLCYLPEQEPGENEKVFLGAVADQTAVAIENVRLFAGVRGKAALEERQRLARELHDSVSQALYGIALGAKTARALLDKNPERVADPLEYVLSLAEAGLAEMRALIFELRPESLETEGLIAALEKQTAALKARHEIEVEATLCDEPEASMEAKETVYRIAQEALHNIVKHARATNVEIKVECDSGWIALEVSDDGVGFDAQGDFPGHLGLRSMRERALRLGGTLEVETAPGRGTQICARIPV
jgi:PAS domain S-box-containing protein